MNKLPASVLYVFRGDRAKLAVSEPRERMPSEFLYGYPELKIDKKCVVASRGKRDSLISKFFHLFEAPFSRRVKLGLPLEIYPLFKQKIHAAKLIFCCYDAIAMSMLFWKKLKRVPAPVIIVLQSLPERLASFKSKPWLVRLITSWLKEADQVLTLSKVAHAPLIEVFGLNVNQLDVMQFGVDTDFWKPGPKSEIPYMLSVGNDRSRDWQTLEMAIPKNIACKVITRRKVSFTHVQIDLESNVSDIKLREAFQEALFTVIPSVYLRYESAGLSSVLQSMACGTPVITARNPALEELFKDQEHLLFYEPSNVLDLNKKISCLYQDEDLRRNLAKTALAKLQSSWTTQHMALDITGQIERVLSRQYVG